MGSKVLQKVRPSSLSSRDEEMLVAEVATVRPQGLHEGEGLRGILVGKAGEGQVEMIEAFDALGAPGCGLGKLPSEEFDDVEVAAFKGSLRFGENPIQESFLADSIEEEADSAIRPQAGEEEREMGWFLRGGRGVWGGGRRRLILACAVGLGTEEKGNLKRN